ncbi:hypothetical protein R3P38DRAFT_2795600 [Favolaschia claudopus]|uniref:JmjC domain-containing protein n=1 Tax=Favolaschia claudopus TaxID=2862362 RepID=A0AAW0A6V4_9AGAR
MSEPRLSETPLFTRNCWSSQPLVDNTWHQLPNDVLREPYSAFIAAIKVLDCAGYPDYRLPTLDGDFCMALGVSCPPAVELNTGNNKTNHTAGRALAWMYLLHFQVLDLMLAALYPRETAVSVTQCAKEHWTQPTIKVSLFLPSLLELDFHSSFVPQLLKKLQRWNEFVSQTKSLISSRSTSSASTDPIDGDAAESFGLALKVVGLEKDIEQSVLFKNMNAIAMALVWILELGTKHAPVLVAGKIDLAPLTYPESRYKALAGSSVTSHASPPPAATKGDLKDRLSKLGSGGKLLRSLSYILNLSPTLVFIPCDLQQMHIDVFAQQEVEPPILLFLRVGIHSLLSSSPKGLSALPFVEHCVHTAIRTICATHNATNDLVTNLIRKCEEMPPMGVQDKVIFETVLNIYSQKPSNLQPPIVSNPPPLATTVSSEPAASSPVARPLTLTSIPMWRKPHYTKRHSLPGRIINLRLHRTKTKSDPILKQRHQNLFSRLQDVKPAPAKVEPETRTSSPRKTYHKRKASESIDKLVSKKRTVEEEDVAATETSKEQADVARPEASMCTIELDPDLVLQRTMEYKLLYDVSNSAVTLSDSSLEVLSLAAWDSASSIELVEKWGTGCNFYIQDLRAGVPIRDLADLRTRLVQSNTMKTPIEVQVQGLRTFPGPDDKDAEVDYTKSIRSTTVTVLLDQAQRQDGLVLNALGLPGGHGIHHNPLLDTGFDLQFKAFWKTNNLPGFSERMPPYEEMYFKLLGLAHTLSMFHVDITMTWIYIAGPGEKFWISSRPRGNWQTDDLSDTRAFSDFDPDQASLSTHDYEITALPAGGGIFLQQPGRRHAVVGTGVPTMTVGGYFLCASRMRAAIAVLLHIVMMPHLLTNADHVGLWQFLIRISMFWLHTIQDCPEEINDLKEYLPDLSKEAGWLDVIYLASVIVLMPCLDHRNYGGPGTPSAELQEAAAAGIQYTKWRRSFKKGKPTALEAVRELYGNENACDMCLLHMAIALSQYHSRIAEREPTAEIFESFTPEAFHDRLRACLKSYKSQLLKSFDAAVNGPEIHTFFMSS